jgi:hypothetical protein
MITNFEQITSELNPKELEIVPRIIKAFKKYTKENPIKAPEIVSRYNANIQKGDTKLSQPRLRKICNYIRSYGMLPLIATSKGYYVSYDKQEIKLQIESLRERANSIENCAIGLQEFLK